MAFSNPYTRTLRNRRKSHYILPLSIIAIIVFFLHNNHTNSSSSNLVQKLFKVLLFDEPPIHDTALHHHHHNRQTMKHPINHDTIKKQTKDSTSIKTSKPKFIPTLRNKKIFFEVVTVGLKQFSYLEDIIDSVRDMCEAGAHVSFHITSSNCHPNPDKEYGECPIRNQSSEDTEEDNFNIETISHLNERVRCRNPEGSLEMKIHLVSPDWGKQIVDHHRLLFYEHIDQGFDVFVHTEDDTLIRPTTVLAFMHEMDKVRQLVGDKRLPDYSIGFMRYENEIERNDRRRVVWEFVWDDQVQMVDHPNIEGLYFISPPWHHQGMFMATEPQLLGWKNRGPDCHFDKIERRPGYHTERISGALDLYDKEYCNVTQLLPLDTFDDLLVHHLPNKNNQRSPSKILSTRDLHKMRLWKMQSMDESRKNWIDESGKYNGIQMIKDERNASHRMHFNLENFEEYVKRGGRLTDEQVKYWD